MVLSSRRRKEQKKPLRSEERNNINNNKNKDNEKQRFLEISNPAGNISINSCINSNQHYELHGPRPHLHVKEMPPLFDSEGITFLVKYMVERVIILFRILIPLAIPRQRWSHVDDRYSYCEYAYIDHCKPMKNS